MTSDSGIPPTTTDKINKIALQYAAVYPEADPEAIKLYFRLEEIGQRFQQASMQLVQSLLPGFKGWQGAILRALYLAPGQELPESEIGNSTMIASGEIERQLEVLEEDGFITRAADPRTESGLFLRLTPNGAAVCEKLLPARARLMTGLCGSFTEKELLLLNGLLARL